MVCDQSSSILAHFTSPSNIQVGGSTNPHDLHAERGYAHLFHTFMRRSVGKWHPDQVAVASREKAAYHRSIWTSLNAGVSLPLTVSLVETVSANLGEFLFYGRQRLHQEFRGRSERRLPWDHRSSITYDDFYKVSYRWKERLSKGCELKWARGGSSVDESARLRLRKVVLMTELCVPTQWS